MLSLKKNIVMKNGLNERNVILVIYPHRNIIKTAFEQFPTKSTCRKVATSFINGQLVDTHVKLLNQNINNTTVSLGCLP